MWDQIVEESFQKRETISRSDREFLRSLLSFWSELQAIKMGVKRVIEAGEKYLTASEYTLIQSCFCTKEDPAHKIRTIKEYLLKMLLDQKIDEEYDKVIKALGITDEILQLIWRIGKSLLDGKEYEWAYQVLFLLLSLNPTLTEGWMAYGYVNQRLKSMNTATNAYLTARSLSDKPEIDIMIADCYADMHILDDAKSYLERYKKGIGVHQDPYLPYVKTVEEKIMRIDQGSHKHI